MNLSHIFTALPLIMTLVSQAEIFTIHITNTYGNYVFSEVKRFHIDLGTDLESVQEARFMCSGIMSTEGCPGSFFAYLGENRQGKIPRRRYVHTKRPAQAHRSGRAAIPQCPGAPALRSIGPGVRSKAPHQSRDR